MNIRAIAFLFFALLSTSFLNTNAHAGFNAEIDLSNPRIVPVYQIPNPKLTNKMHGYGEASYSGFLYSSRIVFSAAHSVYTFNQDGKKILNPDPYVFVGKPNSKAGDFTGAVRVIKKIVSPNYRFEGVPKGDFVIYILEKDLIDAPPISLLTPESETEVRKSKLVIKMHGYGEYKDRCTPGEKMPCSKKSNKSLMPRSLSSLLISLTEAENLAGYKTPELSEMLIIQNGKTGFGCGGDSGGSVTAEVEGKFTYLSPTPGGMNGYACGASPDFDGATGRGNGNGGINYIDPVYIHSAIIKEAEEFVAAQILIEKSKNSICQSVTGKKKITTTKSICPSGYKKVNK